MRVERSFEVGRDQVWLELQGRNPDGTAYHTSELWVRGPDGWAERQFPSEAEDATRPDDFALTALDTDAMLALSVQQLAAALGLDVPKERLPAPRIEAPTAKGAR